MHSKPLFIRPEAKEEAIQAREWYEEQNSIAAERFVEELEAAFEVISRRPRASPFYERPFRFLSLKKFPYLVIYRERGQEIEIMAVAHARRAPGYWKDRTK
jgi:toxin ParE1/3/4